MDILPIGDALMNENKWTEMKQNGFYSEHDNAHKTARSADENYKTEFWLHEIFEMSTKHYILSPVITRLYGYLHLPMAYHIVHIVHLVVCIATGTKSLLKRALHIV